MTLELIVFIAAILFGIFIYWRESRNNSLYRFFNKVINSEALQMKATDKTGFVYKQSFLLRLVFVGFLFLIGILVLRFLVPIDVATVSIFTSMIIGTLIGTYLANFIFKSSEVIEEQTDSLEHMVHDTIEKGKDFIDDLKSDEPEVIKSVKGDVPKVEEKSARERLKDKGLL
jgi:small-conductance mechanosensitive channel